MKIFREKMEKLMKELDLIKHKHLKTIHHNLKKTKGTYKIKITDNIIQES